MEGLETPTATKCFKGKVSPFCVCFDQPSKISGYINRIALRVVSFVLHSAHSSFFVSRSRVLLVVRLLPSVIHQSYNPTDSAFKAYTIASFKDIYNCRKGYTP
jgi:hypothetical protein